MTGYFPKYITYRAIVIYMLLIVLVPLVFGYPMKWYFWLFGFIEVAGFFYFSNVVSIQWRYISGKSLERKLFRTSATIRLIYVLISYCLYSLLTGLPFEFNAGDSLWYDDMGRLGADIIWGSGVKWSVFFKGVSLTDIGYPVWLTIVYALTGKSIILSRCIKALISAWTVVFVYRIAKRNFGDGTGRLAGILCMLMPNLIYYCGLNLKETEMLFLTVVFIDRADIILQNKKTRMKDIFIMALSCAAVYFFRGVLSVLLIMSFAATFILGNTKIKKGGKWAIESVLIIAFVGVLLWSRGASMIGIGDYSSIQAEQDANMEWRASRSGGNTLAVNASSTIYAPLIFTIPFPTLVDVGFQEDQQMIHGGNYVKNITSFLTILALLMLLLSGKWKDNLLPIAFTIGYLIILVFSNYAHSERFHIPSLPFELMFAAYGITHFKAKHKNWFILWLCFIFAANIGWAWFKLRGRGM